MLNTNKIAAIFLSMVLLGVLPKASYAQEDQHHHRHLHANPDLTLVSGMDNIDRRVLVASGPDQCP